MIQFVTGNLLKAEVEALVNTVNTKGVMGKGIALQFRQAFPEIYRKYKAACEAGEIRLGHVQVVPTERLVGPKYVINFPTKEHWRSKSRLEDVRVGLEDLVSKVKEHGISSIALPPLGCGNGKLRWQDVRPLIEAAFQNVEDVIVIGYLPGREPPASDVPVGTSKPKWTRARALIVQLMELYRIPDYALTQLEVQKLAYFLQVAGEPSLKLRFEPHLYGPYADNLFHLLRVLEGHMVTGALDRSPGREITIAKGAARGAKEFLKGDDEASAHVEMVADLIEGWETPYGMELLATVHWIAGGQPGARSSVETAVAGVQSWSKEKKRKFDSGHIAEAWHWLKDLGWFERCLGSEAALPR